MKGVDEAPCTGSVNGAKEFSGNSTVPARSSPLKNPGGRVDTPVAMTYSFLTLLSRDAGRRWLLGRLVLCLCLVASPVAQAQWAEIEKDDDIVHSWDKDSVRRVHVSRYVWTLTDLPKAVKGPTGENYQSTMTRWRVHCKTDMFVRLSVSYFEKPQGKGREVNAEDVQEWRTREAPIRPGSYLALLKKELCDSNT